MVLNKTSFIIEIQYIYNNLDDTIITFADESVDKQNIKFNPNDLNEAIQKETKKFENEKRLIIKTLEEQENKIKSLNNSNNELKAKLKFQEKSMNKVNIKNKFNNKFNNL